VSSSLTTAAELRSVTTTTGVHRLGFIDGLRGLAAVYVVISHIWDTAFSRRPPSVHTLREVTAFLGFGRYAVSLFIVVSGFSIGLGTWRGGLRWPGGTRTYVRRRVQRIWPPYAAAVLISSLLAATVLSKDDGTLFDQANKIRPLGVIDHLALIQDIHWWGPAGSEAFWSIAVEFHIYFFFLLVPLSPLNDFLIGPGAAFLITQMVSGRYPGVRRLLSSRPAVWLGDCSYSIYLIHAVVIEIVWRVAVAPVTSSPLLRLVLELVLGVGASVLVARCFYYAFERPFLRPAQRPATPPAGSASVPSAAG
jgi:peptidoglycan/LPS O-acetylase OafA/YrhL